MKDELWDARARALGFDSMKDLLTKKYLEQNMSILEVADSIPCAYGTARTLMFQNKIEVRTQKELPKVPVKELRGMTVREIKAKYKIGHSTAWRMKKAVEKPSTLPK